MKFSQRLGITTAIKTIQIEEIDSDLRNGLWNAIKICFLDNLLKYNKTRLDTEYALFSKFLWMHFYKLPIDQIPDEFFRIEAYIRDKYFHYQWFEVYDLLEFIADLDPQTFHFDLKPFTEFCNSIFERENAGYRFIENKVAPITNSTEIDAIETAIMNSGHFSALQGANIHLRNSLDKISDKVNPDYRNSIKESISAVESVAKKISENNNDTLGGALDKIKGKTKIHPALERGFKQIYGYTSDTDGIRHALTEEPNCDFEDAKFMLVSCSAFINYLISKASKSGIKFDK